MTGCQIGSRNLDRVRAVRLLLLLELLPARFFGRAYAAHRLRSSQSSTRTPAVVAVHIQGLADECDSTSQTRLSSEPNNSSSLVSTSLGQCISWQACYAWTFQRLNIRTFGTIIHHAQALGTCAYGTIRTAILGLGPNFTSGGLMFSLLTYQA